MTKQNDPTEGIEFIKGGEFLDDQDVQIEEHTVRSGQGRLSGQTRSSRDAEPQIVCGPGGRLGWQIQVPGSRPLATPAISKGRVFVGGGFGSHEFYALEAETGRPIWRLRTNDDGPTAATLLGDYVAFNTESCTVCVVNAENGRVVWQSWLGDPLMSQPALRDGSLFMAYPDRDRRHWLSAFGLEDGEPRWKTELIADVMSAPIAAGGSIYCTALDGTVYRIDPENGEVHWSISQGATSAPWFHRGRIFLSLREKEEGRRGCTTEGYDTVHPGTGRRSSQQAHGRRYAQYLHLKEKGMAKQLHEMQDASVGFQSAPPTAKLHMFQEHVGLGHVMSVWSYQGSRPEVFDDGIFTVQGDAIQRLDLKTKRPLWRTRLEFSEDDAVGRVMSPPAVTASRLYVTSALGDLLVLDRRTGEKLWALNVGSPILAQPAVAEGKVFFGTANGKLCAFEADDPDPVGWPMWGGGPGHNGC